MGKGSVLPSVLVYCLTTAPRRRRTIGIMTHVVLIKSAFLHVYQEEKSCQYIVGKLKHSKPLEMGIFVGITC